MNIAEIITQAPPHSVALAEGARSWSYAELDAAIWRAAAWFRRQGIAPGDVVGVSLPSDALHAVCIYALARMGAVQLALDQRESRPVREYLARRFKAVAVVGESLQPDPAWLFPDAAPVDQGVAAPGDAAPWRIALGAGTTDTVRATVQSHAMGIAWLEIAHSAFQLAPTERYLAHLPLGSASGLRPCMEAHWIGGAAIVGPPPRKLDDFLEHARKADATYLALTPFHLDQMVKTLPAGRPQLPGVRMRICSMSASAALRQEVRTCLTDQIVVAYGTGDFGSPLTVLQGGGLDRHAGSVGFAVEGVELEVVDEEGNEARRGEEGVVRLRALPMPPEYLGNPAASAAAFRQGWYYPGDRGMLSPEGALHLRGRSDDLINFAGLKVYPSEIESVLLAHASVAEAAAFAVPSERYQHVPTAAVVLRSPATAKALLAHCVAWLGPRAPQSVVTLTDLPRDAAGHVDKHSLGRRIASRLMPRA